MDGEDCCFEATNDEEFAFMQNFRKQINLFLQVALMSVLKTLSEGYQSGFECSYIEFMAPIPIRIFFMLRSGFVDSLFCLASLNRSQQLIRKL